MAEFKTPKRVKRIVDNPELHTPIKIPPSPLLKQIGYGCGVNVFSLERSPRVGFLRSPWAIKCRNKKVDGSYATRIKVEAEILRKLDHPNIIGYRACTVNESGEAVLFMEKLDISLGDMIEQRIEDEESQFPAKQILNVGFEIAKGLEYLHHEKFLLHGDLKSYNILVSKDLQTIKICDFGVSVPLNKNLEIDTSEKNYTYVGTRCWSAPEIIHETSVPTNKADMWAYGLVLYEMIALSPPHVDDDSENEFSDSDIQTIDSNSSMPDVLKSFEEEERRERNYGTRPRLPAIDLGPEYSNVLEIFYACTDEDPRTRPSAKGVVRFFKNLFKK